MSHHLDHIIKALVYADGRLETSPERLTVEAAATASAIVLCSSALLRFPRPTHQSIIVADSYGSPPDAAISAGICLATKGEASDAVRLPGLLDRFFLASDAAGRLALVKITSTSENAEGELTTLIVVHRADAPYPGRARAIDFFFQEINQTLARPLVSLAMAEENSNQALTQIGWTKGTETSFLRAARAALRRAAVSEPDFRVINDLSIMASVDCRTSTTKLTFDVNFRDLLRASGRSLNDTFACSALIQQWNKELSRYHRTILSAGLPHATAMLPIDRTSKIYPPSNREYADGWERVAVPAILTINLDESAHEELVDEALLATLEETS